MQVHSVAVMPLSHAVANERPFGRARGPTGVRGSALDLLETTGESAERGSAAVPPQPVETPEEAAIGHHEVVR